MDKTNLVKLMFDYKNDTVEKFSKAEAKEAIHKALVEANGGSTKLDIKSFRRNPELFEIIEEIVSRTVAEGLKGDEFFMNFVEEKNIAEGDAPEYVVKKDSTLVVADVARGTQGIRRQRIGETQSFTLKPTVKGIKVYDELTRVLAGRADINELTDAIVKAVKKRRLDDIYAAWSGLTKDSLGADYYPTAGAYSEDALLDVCNHVSAANDGAKVMLVCTLKGARKIKTETVSDAAKNDMYNGGYAAKWNGIDVMVVPQRHKVGTSEFIFDDDKIAVIPVGMDKPIKQTIGGSDILKVGEATDNADLTIDITYLTSFATMVVTGKKFGIVELV